MTFSHRVLAKLRMVPPAVVVKNPQKNNIKKRESKLNFDSLYTYFTSNQALWRFFMTVSITTPKNIKYKNLREHLFIFDDSETLTQGILFLYRLKLTLKSSLYKTEQDYRLIISSPSFKPYLITLGEFCKRRGNLLETEYTKEYGKPLIEKNAIKTFGKCFLK